LVLAIFHLYNKWFSEKVAAPWRENCAAACKKRAKSRNGAVARDILINFA